MPLGIGVEQIAGIGERHFLADAAHHVLQRAAVGRVIMDVVGRQDGAAVAPARCGRAARSAPDRRRDRDSDAATWRSAGSASRKPRQLRLERVEISPGQAMKRDALRHASATSPSAEVALALRRPHLAQAQQPRQPPISLAVAAGKRAGSAHPSGPAGTRSAAAAPRPSPRCASAPRRPGCCGRRCRSRPCRARARASTSSIASDAPRRKLNGRRHPKLDERRAARSPRAARRADQFLAREDCWYIQASAEQPVQIPCGRPAAAVADHALRDKSRSGGRPDPRPGNNRAAARSTARATIRARSARAPRPARCHAPRAATRTAAARPSGVA